MRSIGAAFVRVCVAEEEARKRLLTAYHTFTRLEEDGCSDLKRLDVGYTAPAQNSLCGHAIDVLLDGPHRLVSVSSLLKHIGKAKNISVGQQVHQHVVECGYGWESLLGNCLMHMYGKCGLLEDAQATFDRLPNPDTYSWNILINLYGHNRGVGHAKSVFNMMPNPNVVSWNAILTLLALNGQHKEALNAFSLMQLQSELPNDVTFICVVDACCAIASREKGKQVHVMITCAGFEGNAIVGTALINMYGKCGCLGNARSVFSRLQGQDVVSWTAMIGGLAQNSCNEEALECFQNMQLQGVLPNDITFICAMEACANLAALNEGLQIHTSILMVCYEHVTKISNALIDMYSKCGSLEAAVSVFQSMHHRTLVSWNAMIVSFGLHGYGKDALALFWNMQAESLKPDIITFIAAMNACSHMGLVDDGLYLFLHMHDDHGLVYDIDHYVCIIDLLGRAGQLDEAEQVILNISSGNTVVAWVCLLSACKIHGDAERGSYAASRCFKMDQSHAAPYVMLSNIYMEVVFSELQGLQETSALDCTSAA